MVNYTARYINEAFTLASGDTLALDMPYPARLQVGAISDDVTVSTQIITGGTFRDISPVVTSAGVLISSDIFPPKSVFKFTGGASEVKVYGV